MSGAFVHDDDNDRSAATKVVFLSRRDVDDAARLMKLLVEGRSETAEVSALADGPPQAVTRDELIHAAGQEMDGRRRRARLLSEGMFGEPAWEMLLLLYIEQRGRRLTIAHMARNLRLPGTTTLRWLSYLQDKQLVEREPHPTDQRAAFVKLTTKAVEALDAYFSEAIARSP